MKKYASVEEYLADIPADKAAAIQHLREQIKAVVPEIEEKISWGVPTFKLNGQYVAGVAAYKNHVSFTPWGGWNLVVTEEELGDIEHTDMILHFTLEKPLPEALVARLILARIAENEATAKAKAGAKEKK
jgi:uncharacterized protein YdhG (YjbR/CyaY superfamily)